MKKLIIVLSVCLISIQLSAQNKQEKIVELLNIMQSEQMIDKMFDNMVQVLKQQNAKELNKEQEDELMIFVMSEMKAMTKKAMSDDFPRIYDKYLEEKDIDALIVFYKSPTGQKFLRVSPDIQKEFMQSFMTDYMPEFQKKVEQKKQDIKGD
jgi:hypothetical protein